MTVSAHKGHVWNHRFTITRGNLILIVMLPLVILGITFGVAYKAALDASQSAKEQTVAQQRFIHCLTTWANESSARTSALDRFGRTRESALDGVVRAYASHNTAALHTALGNYVVASDAYNKIVAKYPVPKPPRLVCKSVQP